MVRYSPRRCHMCGCTTTCLRWSRLTFAAVACRFTIPFCLYGFQDKYTRTFGPSPIWTESYQRLKRLKFRSLPLWSMHWILGVFLKLWETVFATGSRTISFNLLSIVGNTSLMMWKQIVVVLNKCYTNTCFITALWRQFSIYFFNFAINGNKCANQ